MRILSPALLAISGLAAVASASPFYMKNFAPGKKPIRKPIDKPVAFKNAVLHTDQNSTGSCDASSTLSTTKSPLQNIFAALTEEEAASVTKFLHEQAELNLTANINATSWDNVIVLVELLQPNKSDALPYLNGEGPKPDRYSKATIQFQATLEPYLKEFMVGPLPVSNETTLQPLDYPFNKGVGMQRIYNADPEQYGIFLANISASVEDILMEMFNGTYTNSPDDPITIGPSDPLWIDDKTGAVTTWNEYTPSPTGMYGTGSLLRGGLAVRTDLTGRDPSKWSVLGWYYNGEFFKTTDEFKSAFHNGTFEYFKPTPDGDWGVTAPNAPALPHDEIPPPVSVQPAGPRFGVDTEETYIEWMDYSFFIGFTRDTGMRLFDIKYKGERIVYELGMQEAVAHYAGMGPGQSALSFLDSYYGFGPNAFELVGGYDCPAYATMLNTSFYWREARRSHQNSICVFELDAGYPAARHTALNYVYATKNVHLVVRSVSTLGNYDYMFEYAFFHDGSIHVTVRASGYIAAAFWAANADYGFHIQDTVSGSMHDHVLNYKLDLDIHGTKNSLMKVDVIPTTENYPWADEPRNTMKLNKSFIATEDDSKINWAPNLASSYAVVNKDTPNKWGEYPGYRISPGTANTAHLTIINSTNLKNSARFAEHHLYAVQQKDTEPRSAYPFSSLDPARPVVDFDKFFDGESLDQEDLVLYFNLGMHHVPDTQDLPNTVFTTAQSTVIISPQNYFLQNPIRQTIQQAEVDYDLETVVGVQTFGSEPAMCAYDMSNTAANLSSYHGGDLVVRKWPYDPSNPFFGMTEVETIGG
ncbi:hypothetical protein H2204_003834 [Knufia peltigerae]|uniref:Amine oxidase n=1 Tax=Knufia peltigerae TaxID=1002370 RepID=A0AA38Y8R5_9EURO|nr:hypothetical protein H2204_003834 [Knufia peltigerae]